MLGLKLGIKGKEKVMLTQLMVKPSSWIEKGIKLSPVRENYLFKFTEELQCRLEELRELEKNSQLNSQETAELAGILELNEIFTLLNARIVAESK
ncbi:MULTISPECIES: hypothetical protein [unclassified Microcystis]|uniref:hypothetical protein n=1 Tax=unclassified Microcystis TaxID=2643300 RepID=UPI002580A1FF|nr:MULTISPECIES: hypothetical protein [unclassified Microcystis]MCU7241595.1 hypothetical protein [Microcystis aeruginosa WS75]